MDKLKTHKFQLVAYLGQGILPFEQWSSVFSNPELHSMPGLVCKGYTVWFPTMLDYLNRPKDIDECIHNLSKEEDSSKTISLCAELANRYKGILSLFSREEQIFINDRRLQNVHGVLSIFRSDRIKTRFYNSKSDQIVVEHIDRKEYRMILKVFYKQMQHSEMELRNRLVRSVLFKEFGEFYLDHLKVDPHLMKIANDLGVLE